MINEIKNFRKNKLEELLNQCTEPQKNLFDRMYGSIDEIPDEKIDWAVRQCEKTIEKNNLKED